MLQALDHGLVLLLLLVLLLVHKHPVVVAREAMHLLGADLRLVRGHMVVAVVAYDRGHASLASTVSRGR